MKEWIINGLFGALIIGTWLWNKWRRAHICKCGHRRDEHDQEWGDVCNHIVYGRIESGLHLKLKCNCVRFERAAR